MRQVLQKRWFLISLIVVIASGLTIGSRASEEEIERLTAVIKPSAITAIVLFLMSFSLDSRHLRESFRAPGPVVWASAVNYAFIPLLAWPLMLLQQTPDFALGLMIAASVPCTMAAASVWTRKAGGNDAVSLLVTTLTNGLCFLLTPFWLAVTASATVELSVQDMVARLVLAVLIPAGVGQLVRLFPGPERLAVEHKAAIGVLAQACILTIVFAAACKAGTHLHRIGPQTSLWGMLLVWGTCVGIHLAAMGVGLGGARLMEFRLADIKAVAFASSQKTLPIGLLIATDKSMFGNPDLLGTGLGVPFAVFPMLLYHASQLFVDTVVADRFASQPPSMTETRTTG